MPVTINASGYIEVYRDGVFVSRHNVESNAIEAVIAHAELNGDGDYELRYPNKVVMSRLRKQVVPFTWNPITLAFVNGTAASVNLAGFLANPENRSVAYSVTGTLPAGVTLTGSTVAYNGTGAVASASVRFNATWGGLTATSALSTVSVNAAQPTNRAPTFTVAPTTATIPSTGGTIQFTATDPDADTLTYTLPTTRTGITINSVSGLVTVASNAAGTSGSITVLATDPSGLYADASCAVTVQAAGAGDVWVFEGLSDGLAGLTTDGSGIAWDAGGFARITWATGGTKQLKYTVPGGTDTGSVLVQFDLRRWGTPSSKQLKVFARSLRLLGAANNITAIGPTATGYSGTNMSVYWSDSPTGGDNLTSLNLTGALVGGGIYSRSGRPTFVIKQSVNPTQDVAGNWATYKLWVKFNDDNIQNGEVAIWRNGVLLLHATNVWLCATTLNDAGAASGVSAENRPLYWQRDYISLGDYSSQSGFYEDYRNLKVGYTRPAELG